jgi:hypothetical protein
LLDGDTGDVRAVLGGAADAVDKKPDDVRLSGVVVGVELPVEGLEFRPELVELLTRPPVDTTG